MSKIVSLKNYREFDNVYKNGTSKANSLLVMYVLKTDSPCVRLGISVSKKTGNSVVRHRITRLIRESFRLSGLMSDSGLDIVVIGRQSAKNRGFAEVDSAMHHLFKLHRIIS